LQRTRKQKTDREATEAATHAESESTALPPKPDFALTDASQSEPALFKELEVRAVACSVSL